MIEEMVNVNGRIMKMSYVGELTPEARAHAMAQLQQMSGPPLQTMGVIQGVTVTIAKATAPASPIWTGTTDVSGVALNAAGAKPSLTYGDYIVSASLVGYTTGTASFNIPALTTGAITLTIAIISQQITITVTT